MTSRTKDGSFMRLFYPSNEKQLPEPDKSTWTRWHLGDEYSRGIASFILPRSKARSFIGTITASLFNWQARDSMVPSVWCGDLLKADHKLPVIVFSHGLCAHRSMYSSVCTQLASHGFLVAAVEHRDGSASGSFTLSESGEKQFVEFELIPLDQPEYNLRNRQVMTRAEECSRALTALHGINSGTETNCLPSAFQLSQLTGRLDLSRPIIAGHSFGGATTIRTLFKDDRFKLGVALDPWMFPLKDEGKTLCAKIKQPLLCISTGAFQTQHNLAVMSNLPEATSSFVTIKGTVHQNQADTPFVLGVLGRMAAHSNSPLDRYLAMQLNNALMLAFIHKHHGLADYCDQQFAEEMEKFVKNNKAHLVYTLYGEGRKMLGWDGFVRT